MLGNLTDVDNMAVVCFYVDQRTLFIFNQVNNGIYHEDLHYM